MGALEVLPDASKPPSKPVAPFHAVAGSPAGPGPDLARHLAALLALPDDVPLVQGLAAPREAD